jgi:hypothetical protein
MAWQVVSCLDLENALRLPHFINDFKIVAGAAAAREKNLCVDLEAEKSRS